MNAFDVGFKKAYSHLKDDLNCKMCRGTINSAMTKAINITPQTALYTSCKQLNLKLDRSFKKKFMMYKNNPFRFYISKNKIIVIKYREIEDLNKKYFSLKKQV